MLFFFVWGKWRENGSIKSMVLNFMKYVMKAVMIEEVELNIPSVLWGMSPLVFSSVHQCFPLFNIL